MTSVVAEVTHAKGNALAADPANQASDADCHVRLVASRGGPRHPRAHEGSSERREPGSHFRTVPQTRAT